MKRILIVIVLVALAGIAGMVVRSSSKGEIAEKFVSHKSGDAREDIRQSYELAPGALVELTGLNGSVNIETADTKTAEVLIERTASDERALQRRRIYVEASANSLRIRSEKKRSGFFSRVFGSEAHERVTLKLPRQVSLFAKGINGAVTVGHLDGSVEFAGINGRISVASAAGGASFKGVNGNIDVALKLLDSHGITLSGINGNINLQLPADANADLEAHGMNGRVVSDLPNVAINKLKHGYSARIGTGGNAIEAKGINGNIRLASLDARTASDAGN